MWEKAKDAVVVAVTTLLIWLVADQNVTERQTVTIPVRVTLDDPQRYASFANPPYQVTFRATMLGRRRHLREFSDWIASKPVFDAPLDEAEEASPRPRVMPSSEIVDRVRRMREWPLTIESIEPRSAPVIIDTYDTVKNVRVQAEYGELKVSATLTPDRVSVRLPRFAAEKLRSNPVATAEAEQRIRAVSRPDGSFQVRVPLTLPALRDMNPDLKHEILPADQVVITGHVEERTATRRKGPVQITWSVPQQVQEAFRIVPAEGTEFRPDIDVTGPKDQIEQLDPREIRAVVDVLAADAEKPRTPIRRRVQFILPPGFTLAADARPYDVVFELEPRSASPPEK